VPTTDLRRPQISYSSVLATLKSICGKRSLVSRGRMVELNMHIIRLSSSSSSLTADRLEVWCFTIHSDSSEWLARRRVISGCNVSAYLHTLYIAHLCSKRWNRCFEFHLVDSAVDQTNLSAACVRSSCWSWQRGFVCCRVCCREWSRWSWLAVDDEIAFSEPATVYTQTDRSAPVIISLTWADNERFAHSPPPAWLLADITCICTSPQTDQS